MKNIKRFLYSCAVLILAALVAGCGLVQVNEDKDRKVVVAEVNGEKVLKGALLDEYRMRTAGYNIPEAQVAEVKGDILGQIIREYIIMQKAAEAGFKITDEVKAKSEAGFESEILSYAEELRNYSDDPEGKDFEAQARKEVDDWMASMGVTKAYYLNRLAVDQVMRTFMDSLTTDLTVSETDIQKYYDEELETQVANHAAIYNAPVRIVIQPEMRRVKHILIKIPQEDINQIRSLRQAQKHTEADALRDSKLAEITDDANAVLSKAKAGENFEALIEEYGEDPGMKDDDFKDGYIVNKDGQMVAEFELASFDLNEGEISELVATDFGYHIIKVYEAGDNVIAPYADKRDEINQILLNEKKNESFNTFIKDWEKAATVKKFEARL